MKQTQNWRKTLDPVIEKSLNSLIQETKDYNYAILKSKDKSKAQMWIALAILNYKIEKILSQTKKPTQKIPKEELNKILKALETM